MSKKNGSSSKKLRIMFNTNAPWSISGYGQQAAEILPRIQKEGYPLACTDFYGLDGGKLFLDGILHYPRMAHVYGSDAMIHHAKDFNADVVMSLQDTWVLNPEDLKQVKRWIAIAPIDHEPCPRIILDKLALAYRIVTYSQFGQEELKKHGLNSTYIPHTVDTTVFKPMDKKERKKTANMPEDSFICGMVAANKDNPPRKSFQEVMDAFTLFLKKVPNAYLYLHTIPDFPGGFPLKEYAQFLGITERVLYPNPYEMNFNMSKEKMALVYNTLDVLLMPSTSEGFGVPAIEAQSCGVPVIVNDFTSMPELIDPDMTGYITDVLYKRFDGLLSYVGVPSAASIYNNLLRVKDSNREAMGKAAREWVVKRYDSDTIFKEKWIPFLKTLEDEIYT